MAGQTLCQNRRPVALGDLSSSLQQIAERADSAVVQIPAYKSAIHSDNGRNGMVLEYGLFF